MSDRAASIAGSTSGIGKGMIRLSVGVEDADELVDDLGAALRASRKA